MLTEYAKPRPKPGRPRPARPKGMQAMSAALWAAIRKAISGGKAA